MKAIKFKNEKFEINEPFEGLFTQGMVCHETYKDSKGNWLSPDEVEIFDKVLVNKNNHKSKVEVGPSESMSKSKKNVIDPQIMIDNYGADAVRLFILSDSPPAKDVQWSDQGMMGSYKFVQKLWQMHKNIKQKIENNENNNIENHDLEKFTNQLIDKFTKNLENFTYNVLVANMYETYNFFNLFLKKELNPKKLKDCYVKILTIFSPLIPHLSSECIEDLDVNSSIIWPEINKKFLDSDVINYVIQINGKKRSLLNAKKDILEDNLIEIVKKDKTLSKYVKNKTINKAIFVKNKLLNLLINE